MKPEKRYLAKGMYEPGMPEFEKQRLENECRNNRMKKEHNKHCSMGKFCSKHQPYVIQSYSSPNWIRRLFEPIRRWWERNGCDWDNR